jgi:crotonobetainyl-CoA:carnitine CoA-transferase CaiB-like acyl-CoA transferase
VVDYAASGTIMQPRGNRSDCYAPHGAYRGTDADDGGERWLSIAVADDQQWTNLLAVLGAPGDPRFATMIARLENQDQLDVYVQGLVLGRDVVEVAHALQSVGVAAYPVQNCLDLHSDENLLAFEFWQWLDQRDAGTMPYEGLSYRLERTGSFQTAAPSLGEHTQELLGELLGMTAREVDRLRETGVVA